VSGKLVGEVLALAPADLSSAELLLLVTIAEQVRNEKSRECWPGMSLICWHMRMTEDGVRKVFQRLAKHGLDVRVPLATDRRGRPIFAYEGARTRYRLPQFDGDLSRLPRLKRQPARISSDVTESRAVRIARDPERQYTEASEPVQIDPPEAIQTESNRRDSRTALLVSATVEINPNSDRSGLAEPSQASAVAT
jgi:hypothetical protein